MAYQRKPDGVFRGEDGRLYEHRGYALRIGWSHQMLSTLRRKFATTLNAALAEELGVSQSTMIRKARELGLEKDPAWLARIWEERRKMAHSAARHKGYPGKFEKGHRPSNEFKPGHQLTEEQQARKRASMHRWCVTHPRAVKEKARKAWETRRRNEGMTPNRQSYDTAE